MIDVAMGMHYIVQRGLIHRVSSGEQDNDKVLALLHCIVVKLTSCIYYRT